MGMATASSTATVPAGKVHAGTGPPETALAYAVKAAVYEGGLAAGVGLKILSPKPLRPQVATGEGRKAFKAQVLERIAEALSRAGVTQGEDGAAIEEAAEAFLAKVQEGSSELVARKVAQGEPPEPGQAGRLEYPLNPDSRTMHEVEGVPTGSRRRWLRLVHQGDVLVQRIPPSPGKAGRNVRGERLEPRPAEAEKPLADLCGPNTVLQEDRVLAECDGGCEENAAGQVRVIPEVEVADVDARTGDLPEAGISQTAILVRGSITAAHRVATSEALFVGVGKASGRVEEGARVSAGHLVVNGTIFGQQDGDGEGEGTIEAQGLCVARQVTGAGIVAGRILVCEDSRFAWLDADEAVQIDGDLVGGTTLCRRVVTVTGNLGSEKGGSRTRLVVPQEEGNSRRERRLGLAIHSQKKSLAELQQKLDALEAAVAKRARSSPFWASLAAGEERQPRNPVEANALRQFMDLSNEKKRLTRSVDDVRHTLRRLQDEGRDEAAAEASTAVLIKVGGLYCLDAVLEAFGEVGEEDLDLQVTYAVEGKRFRNHALRDLRVMLAKQAGDYLQAQSGHIQERQAAIEEMFEGAEHKPSGPKVTHRRFTQAFEWSGEGLEAVPDDMQLVTTAYVDSEDPHRLFVLTSASPRQPITGVELALVRNGVRMGLILTPLTGSVRWQDDAAVAGELDGLAFRGVGARDFLNGAAPAESAGQTAEPTEGLTRRFPT